MGFDVEKVELLFTSSDQAAYMIVESFLLRNILSGKRNVISCHNIYFENLEQIETLKHIKLIVSDSWEVERLIQLVEENSAEALFVDPLANLGTFHATHFISFQNY